MAVNNEKKHVLDAHSGERENLSSGDDDAADGPVDGGGDVEDGGLNLGAVGAEILAREVEELDDLLGDLDDLPDESVERVELGPELGRVLEHRGKLFEERECLGQRVRRVQLEDQTELPERDRERHQSQHRLRFPAVVLDQPQDVHHYRVDVHTGRALAIYLP